MRDRGASYAERDADESNLLAHMDKIATELINFSF